MHLVDGDVVVEERNDESATPGEVGPLVIQEGMRSLTATCVAETEGLSASATAFRIDSNSPRR